MPIECSAIVAISHRRRVVEVASRMIRTALVVCLLAACSSKSSSSGEGSGTPIAAAPGTDGWKETDPKRHVGVIWGQDQRMCTCKDKACGDDVAKDMTAYSARVSPDIKLDDEQKKKVADYTADIARCQAALK
jgi:hypothetical protein